VESSGTGYSTAPGGALAAAVARQHPGHADGGDETRATKNLTPCGGKCEHALPALADFRGSFSLRNAFADPTERLLDCSGFFIIALGIYGRHNSSPFRWRVNNRIAHRRAASAQLAARAPRAATPRLHRRVRPAIPAVRC